MSASDTHPGPLADDRHNDLTEVAQAAVALVERWLTEAGATMTAAERASADRLQGVVADDAAVGFTMRFVDRVVRPDDDRAAAEQLAALVANQELPGFLGPIDRMLLRAGARLGPLLPGVVMPLARRRMRALVGHLVVDADPAAMAAHVSARRAAGFGINVNLLGEAVLGEREAQRRFERSLALLDQPDVDYVSVKLSAVVSQLNLWDHEGSIERMLDRLRPLMTAAANTSPPTFVNLDMEEYHDLELTLDAFMRVLDEPELHHADAGIVLQAYLPDALPALQRLISWATERHARTVDGRAGGTVKVRLVKGANLAMEQVDAAVHGWRQAPYATKADTDANYKRCLDWLIRPEHLSGVRLGVASHNLFDCAFARLLAERRGVGDAVALEMLEGMAPTHARVARDDTGELLLYTPVVAADDFDVAISYLFRRLEENAAPENIIRYLADLEPGSEQFELEADRFVTAVADRASVGIGPRRHQDRSDEQPVGEQPGGFVNEPDTDATLAANRTWMQGVFTAAADPGAADPAASIVEDAAEIDRIVAAAREAQRSWWAAGGAHRRHVLLAVGAELARRRGDLLAAMIAEGNKTAAQADPEVSEAIDFARYYADRAPEIQPATDDPRRATFDPFGVVAVVPPWNFPTAIPAGGVLSALAAGNSVILKPAPETPRCAEIVAECCWAAGVPTDVLHYVRTRDDDVGRHLVANTGIGAVILTGGWETAQLFRSWRPERPLLAETSGKNALIITPAADIDLAVADLVASAFGHGGQKCSAASLAIAVGPVASSPRFRRQLIDAVSSLRVGPAVDVATDLAPLIAQPAGKLARALTSLEPGEEWLVEPERHDDGLWSPGVRIGVRPGTWFHQTECFGPVLGVMSATDLDEAIAWQNATDYGLTGGIHSLDPDEIEQWLDRVEVGNAYVNRVTTGAIVQRQPFGGWKRSSVGPGAKAGGPNYVAQLGHWHDDGPAVGDEGAAWLAQAAASDEQFWRTELSVAHDPTGLFCEENTFRYRPLPAVIVRVEADVDEVVRRRVANAVDLVGVAVEWSTPEIETQAELAARLAVTGVERVRVLGAVEPELRDAANAVNIHLADGAVTADGSRELLHYVREQAISRTLHRYGNVISTGS
ncbi:MAG: proline dehydrogenase family protein [Actinomycetota bacterium]